MKILIIHNKYGKHSGEETSVFSQIEMLEENGHEVITYFRSSEEIEKMPLGKIRALLAALYNPRTIKELRHLIESEKPDLVHIHNLYPLISPSALPFIKSYGIPVVMTVHNYRLVCPNGLFYTNGKVCEKCTGGLMEINAVINNCEKSYLKSIGYALRNFWARKMGYYGKNVNRFICLTEFQKKKLISNGFDTSKFTVVNHVKLSMNSLLQNKSSEKYIGYVGRLSEEKGVSTVLETAKLLPNIKFKLAGSLNNKSKWNVESLENVEMMGFLKDDELDKFYADAWIIVFPSVCYETFGLTLLEAMSHKKPILASDIAGIPEIVKNGDTGLLFEPGNANDLKNKIQFLEENPKLVRSYGDQGYERVKTKFAKKNYYDNLMNVYNDILLKK